MAKGAFSFPSLDALLKMQFFFPFSEQKVDAYETSQIPHVKMVQPR